MCGHVGPRVLQTKETLTVLTLRYQGKISFWLSAFRCAARLLGFFLSREDQLHRSRAAELEHGRSEAAQVSELQDLLSTVRTEHETLRQTDIECQSQLKKFQDELSVRSTKEVWCVVE